MSRPENPFRTAQLIDEKKEFLVNAMKLGLELMAHRFGHDEHQQDHQTFQKG